MSEASLYWVGGIAPHRLALTPRPRAGEWLSDEIGSWRCAGVDCVISLLEQAEVRELGLEEEALLCASEGIAYLSFPIPDRGTPASAHKLDLLLTDVAAQLRGGRAVVVHCRAGIGRSGIIAACLLHRIGVPAKEVFARLSAARGMAVPDTDAQIAWTRQSLRG